MRKTTTLFYNEGDVKKIIKDELKFAKTDWLEDFTEKIAKFKNEVLNGLDQVMGELKAIREEQTVSSQHSSEHSDTLENHELRLSKLEKPSASAIT